LKTSRHASQGYTFETRHIPPRFVDGHLISAITTQFLAAWCDRFGETGKDRLAAHLGGYPLGVCLAHQPGSERLDPGAQSADTAFLPRRNGPRSGNKSSSDMRGYASSRVNVERATRGEQDSQNHWPPGRVASPISIGTRASAIVLDSLGGPSNCRTALWHVVRCCLPDGNPPRRKMAANEENYVSPERRPDGEGGGARTHDARIKSPDQTCDQGCSANVRSACLVRPVTASELL